jgi:hypothetical protein
MLSASGFRKVLVFGGVFVVLLCFYGCSSNSRPLEVPTLYSAPGPIEESELAGAEPEAVKSIELIWLIPGVAVDVYELSYGESPADLKEHIQLQAADLETLDHPDHGPVYRYLLKAENWSGPICYSILAKSSYGNSDTSAPTCVD